MCPRILDINHVEHKLAGLVNVKKNAEHKTRHNVVRTVFGTGVLVSVYYCLSVSNKVTR